MATKELVIGEFALEAKRYSPDCGYCVQERSRRSGRLRYRIVGAFATTSYLNGQAYEEARHEDRYPTVVLAGKDLNVIQRLRGFANAARVKATLEEQYPISEAAATLQTSEQ
jgi:hypothetical protein